MQLLLVTSKHDNRKILLNLASVVSFEQLPTGETEITTTAHLPPDETPTFRITESLWQIQQAIVNIRQTGEVIQTPGQFP